MKLQSRYTHHKVEGLRVGKYKLGLNSTCVVYKIDGTLIDTGPSNQQKQIAIKILGGQNVLNPISNPYGAGTSNILFLFLKNLKSWQFWTLWVEKLPRLTWGQLGG